MKKQFDLAQLEWKLSGWTPHTWRMDKSMEIGASPNAEVPSIPAKVPGSVQAALRDAGVIPDWNMGLSYRECEWVENRHWIYEAVIPDEWITSGLTYRLNCLGLDYCGEVLLNSQLVSEFKGSHIPHVFDIKPKETGNVLRIVFECPPRWLGQFGYTSRMTEWKVRFNYTWDWCPRLVQIGIWDSVLLEATDGREIEELRISTGADSLKVSGKASGDRVRLSLAPHASRITDHGIIREEEVPASEFSLSWDDLPVETWWPNQEGDQPLYTLTCSLLDESSNELDQITRRIGFRTIEWKPCEGAPTDRGRLPENADPWICAVNGRPIFLQGVNWSPIRPNFADVTEADYRKRLELYRDLGMNILRVWGGGFLEKECFYDLCDELGLMVWQEFPLSSSGIENLPPDDPTAIEEMAAIAESYITRRQHHASLILWCGGNELMDLSGKPVDETYPMIKRQKKVVGALDPTRRFLPTSASGPTSYAQPENFGKGIHWDVHGPWKAAGSLEEWAEYWKNHDALFVSETGAPGASSAEIIRRHSGGLDVMPATPENPLWRRTSIWWIEWDRFVGENPDLSGESLEEYVAWSQERQAQALSISAKSCKDRFPRCGGYIIWHGHDCFPCTANTAIVDFDGNPKPAALAVGEIFHRKDAKDAKGG